MEKISFKVNRSKRYEKISTEERAMIVQMKETGATCRQISQALKKNIKTIQSIKSIEKKSEYGQLKKALVQYGYEWVIQNENLNKENTRRLAKSVSKLIKEQLTCETSQFYKLIPEQKLLSNKRRIIQQIVDSIIQKVENNRQAIETSSLTNQCKIVPKEEEIENSILQQQQNLRQLTVLQMLYTFTQFMYQAEQLNEPKI